MSIHKGGCNVSPERGRMFSSIWCWPFHTVDSSASCGEGSTSPCDRTGEMTTLRLGEKPADLCNICLLAFFPLWLRAHWWWRMKPGKRTTPFIMPELLERQVKGPCPTAKLSQCLDQESEQDKCENVDCKHSHTSGSVVCLLTGVCLL